MDTDFDIKIDNTWGDGDEDTSDDEDPDQASFAFWVMTSPEEIQVSLDKRDGSHWELYNCNDAASEESQTVQMMLYRQFAGQQLSCYWQRSRCSWYNHPNAQGTRMWTGQIRRC